MLEYWKSIDLKFIHLVGCWVTGGHMNVYGTEYHTTGFYNLIIKLQRG